MSLLHLRTVKVKSNMAIFALQASTDQPRPEFPSRFHLSQDATSHTRGLGPRWVGALSTLALDRWSQPEYFGPFAGLPLGVVQQPLFKVSVALWFVGLDGCHPMTAPHNHPV